MSIKSELNQLTDPDIMSLLFFAIYKLTDSPDASSLSELAYILDKSSLLNLCEYFGGCTITIPKVSDIEELMAGLLMYQYIDVDRLSYEEALERARGNHSASTVRSAYQKIKSVLTDYSISHRGTV